MRTAPVPDLSHLTKLIDDLRERTAAAGRAPGDVEVVVAGRWPMLDVRRGWEANRLREDVQELAGVGVDRVVLLIRGDDPGASEDTVRRLGDDLITR